MDNSKDCQVAKKRLFIGIKVTPSENLLNIFNSTKYKLKGSFIKWAKPENFHITLKFLGNTPISEIDSLNQAISSSVSNCAPFHFNLQSIGTFGKAKPKILWIGLKENQNLIHVQHQVVTALENTGYEFKDNLFHPHLTLGRIKQIHSEIILNEIKTEQSEKLIQEINVSEIHLFESSLTDEGPIYTILNSHKLS